MLVSSRSHRCVMALHPSKTGYNRTYAQMSHTVTVTRTTTTTSTSAIILNTGYLKTLPGFLKLLQVIAGAVALFLVVYYRDRYRYITQPPELFFIAIACTFFIGSLCLLIACLISISTAPFISKTSYEVVYHMVAFILYLIAAIILLYDVNNNDYKYSSHQPIYIAAIIGLVVSALYLVSTILAFRAYRGT